MTVKCDLKSNVQAHKCEKYGVIKIFLEEIKTKQKIKQQYMKRNDLYQSTWIS